MNTTQFLLTAWDWNPLVLGAFAIALLAYGLFFFYGAASRLAQEVGGLAATPVSPGKPGALALGWTVCLLTLVSPLDVLADNYLFSAHMLQHLLLLLIVPPLLIWSLPAWSEKKARKNQTLWRRVGHGLTHPLPAWVAGVGAMWLWHAPALCNAASSSQFVHAVQVFTLLALGALFWWPICGPQRNRRLPVLAGVLYLFSACVGCTLLGILITFSPVQVCSIYLHPSDPLGILPLIRNQWNMTPDIDQKIGGLLMWVPACAVYLSVIMGMLLRWFAIGDEVEAGRAVHSLNGSSHEKIS